MNTLSSRVHSIWKFTTVHFLFDLQWYKQSWKNSGEASKYKQNLRKPVLKEKERSKAGWNEEQDKEQKESELQPSPFDRKRRLLFHLNSHLAKSSLSLEERWLQSSKVCLLYFLLPLFGYHGELILDLQLTISLTRTRIQFYITSPLFTNYKKTKT